MVEKVVYQGGQHKVVCDGVRHYLVDKQGRHPDGWCWCKKVSTNKKEEE